MNIAIAHDYLNQYGGAERVLEVFLELFPKADVYTLLYDEEHVRGRFAENIAGTSVINFPFVRRHHRAFIPVMPLVARTVHGGKIYDILISASAGYAKGFPIRARRHICYCYTPLRYAWEDRYLRDQPYAPARFARVVGAPLAAWFRRFDAKAATRVDEFIAISEYIRGKIKRCYGRDARVVYPPLEPVFRRDESAPIPAEPYYLMVGRLLYYKRFDLGIKACERLGRKLVVVGDGPEAARLKAAAGRKWVSFVRGASDEQLRALYTRAAALIMPQIEDFGLVAAEALACGTPVIAYREGGGEEIVRAGENGLLIAAQSPEAVAAAIKEYEASVFDPAAVVRTAERFSKRRFVDTMNSIISSAG